MSKRSVDRWASVDVTALPLQLLLLARPEWQDRPVAVVDEDKPNGTILWVNRAARRFRIRAGSRYAEALSLCSELCAGAVSDAEIEQAIQKTTEALRRFTPGIEASRWSSGSGEPGVFWLDASGFRELWPSLDAWAVEVVQAVRDLGFYAAIAVGFDRFSTYVLARAEACSVHPEQRNPEQRRLRPPIVHDDPEAERTQSARVPLRLLDLDPKLRQALRRLAITTVGELRALPAEGLFDRFGKEAFRLQQLASGTLFAPLDPDSEVELACERFDPDPEVQSLDRDTLLFLIKSRLCRMCQLLATRGEAIKALQLTLLLDATGPASKKKREECIAPATPTLNEVELVDLVRLRLERQQFGGAAIEAAVIGFELRAAAAIATKEQLRLFAENPGRDLNAANRALARLRAMFGEDRVCRAVLREGHLPEARFAWEPLAAITRPKLGAGPGSTRLVRRFLARPKLIVHQPAARKNSLPDGWFAGGLGAGPVSHLDGPFVVSGGWWHGEVHREYWFAETRRGDVFWVFRDRRKRRWYLQGVVE